MSYKVYPVINTELKCDDYRVLINGKETETNTASGLTLNGVPVKKLDGENWNIGDFTDNVILK